MFLRTVSMSTTDLKPSMPESALGRTGELSLKPTPRLSALLAPRARTSPAVNGFTEVSRNQFHLSRLRPSKLRLAEEKQRLTDEIFCACDRATKPNSSPKALFDVGCNLPSLRISASTLLAATLEQLHRLEYKPTPHRWLLPFLVKSGWMHSLPSLPCICTKYSR